MSFSQILNDIVTGKLTGIVIPLAIGLFIAVCSVYIIRRRYGKLVRALIDGRATDEETAKSLKELGMDEKKRLAKKLKSASTLGKTVSSVTDEDGTVRYYIPEDKTDKASALYSTGKSSVLVIIFALILFTITVIAVLKIAPSVIESVSKKWF